MSIRNSRHFVSLVAVTTVALSALSGCYVVPERGPDGSVQYGYHPLPPAGTPIPAPQGTTPSTLPTRLYPANDLATHTGIIHGSVTNLMTGKGRFVVNYQGTVLSGEATRVSNSDRRGVASAYGNDGTYMSCEYQMNTPYQGTGACSFSTGATYKMHIGN